ncbi:Txe/YoeB family addiction module toxin [Flavobacterium cellulosilyticum]|uniref:Putative mRNA interferase YoeB n=1 Tax=Flavobacterium cellulosilyticum TaxID=2541731 RepID=A0A4R5CDP3_9FLAO|nr:Txe/YoeB family addiction module toxin [Flavobacterium cellulosilyticum]TDD96996.1 Txe/YoeB family addiction module toxin [Flavobacterium cellulosilyticum]
MGKYIVAFEPKAQKEIKEHYKSGNQTNIKRIAKILIELSETPFVGIGKPEALKHQLSGFWSREINKKDRLIYKVEEDIVTVFVIAAMGHYSDK